MLNSLEPYNDLPPITTLWPDISPRMRMMAEDTRVAIEILNYAAKSLPSHEILRNTLILQEAKASSDVENIATTNDDLYKEASFDSFNAETKEVSNYRDALCLGFDKFSEKGNLSLSDIVEINHPINRKQKGVRKNLPNFGTLTCIKSFSGNDQENGTVIYTPPHGEALLQTLIIDMLDFVYDDETYDIHPLIKIALAHYQFESIHPFRDGNGRTGRILNVLFLCMKGYLDSPILYASAYITKNKSDYYRLLQITRETEEYADFIEFMLLSFKETAQKTLRIVEGIKSLLQQYTDGDFLYGLKGQPGILKDTVETVFKKVYIRIADLTEKGIHRQTAASYLDQLVDHGLLSKEKIGRDNIYKNIKLLELFEDE